MRRCVGPGCTEPQCTEEELGRGGDKESPWNCWTGQQVRRPTGCVSKLESGVSGPVPVQVQRFSDSKVAPVPRLAGLQP